MHEVEEVAFHQIEVSLNLLWIVHLLLLLQQVESVQMLELITRQILFNLLNLDSFFCQVL